MDYYPSETPVSSYSDFECKFALIWIKSK